MNIITIICLIHNNKLKFRTVSLYYFFHLRINRNSDNWHIIFVTKIFWLQKWNWKCWKDCFYYISQYFISFRGYRILWRNANAKIQKFKYDRAKIMPKASNYSIIFIKKYKTQLYNLKTIKKPYRIQIICYRLLFFF